MFEEQKTYRKFEALKNIQVHINFIFFKIPFGELVQMKSGGTNVSENVTIP